MRGTQTTLLKLLILCIALAACAEKRNRGAEPGSWEGFSGERTENVDIEHQVIELDFDWKKKQAHGRTSISLVTLSNTDTLFLDAAMLVITDVRFLNGPSLRYHHDGEDTDGGLRIILDKNYERGKKLAIQIDYHTNWVNRSDPNNIRGSFGKGIRFFEPGKTEKERRKQLWAVGEPVSNPYWFPSNHRPDDLRTTEITLNVPRPLMAFSNGRLVSKNTTDKEIASYHYREDRPHPPHLTFIVVGEYDDYRQSYQEVTLHNYGYPDEKIGTRESVVRLPDMMKFYSEYTGQKYPYSEYSQIFVQDFGGWKGGLGHSIITENMIDDKTTHEDFLYGWDLTEGEALAYQWFGSYIKPARWNDVWLTKAFTQYFSGLYNQYKNGNTEFLTYQLSPNLSAYLNDWNSGVKTIVVPGSIGDIEAFVNGNAPYAKGLRILHLLRKELGEDKWKRLVQSYVSKFGGKLVTTTDFIETTNEVAGKSMEWFFEQWLYKVGHPIFEVSRHYDAEAKELVLTVIQNQKVDSLVNGRKIPFFKGKMVMEIDDRLEEIHIDAERKNTFKFSAEERPMLVNFDYEDTWIKESSFEKSAETLLQELARTKDVLHRLSIIRKLATTASDPTTDKSTVAKIKKSLRHAALNETYWRMRLIAIRQLSQISSTSTDNGKVQLDPETEEMLLSSVEREKSWAKAWAINFLGFSRDRKYVPIYLEGLKDYSDRVVFMSAIALGKTKDKKAFEALMKLPNKPSWKNQSLISALYGLKELEDPRAYDLAIKSLVDSDNPHWNLGTPVWDHRLAAAHTLAAIGKTEKAYSLIFEQFEDALDEGHMNDIFYNALQVSILADERGKEVFDILKQKYRGDANTMKAITQLETNFLNALK